MAYNKKTWANGDLITKESMNNIENGIYKAHDEIETLKNNTSSGTGLTTEQAQQLNTAYQHSQSTHAPSNAETNVQADWNITDTTSDAYIKNKPTNLVTTDQLPTVPTNVSAFTNDAGYTTETFVTNKIAEAQLGGGSGSVDLSGYQTKNDDTINGTDKNIVSNINNINSQIKDIANNIENKASANYYFEAPIQPSFNILEDNAIWDGENKTQYEFRTEMIDPLVENQSNYVTKNLLGKDTSDTYDIYEYVFAPNSYEQTILLTSGVHGRETVTVYSMYRFMYYLIHEPDIHPFIRHIRDNVRVCIIPVVNPWGGSQSPTKSYGNVNGSSITRNIDFEWELNKDDEKGTVAYSEKEAQILHDWLLSYKDIASFYMDFHTDWSSKAGVPKHDIWVNLTWGDEYLQPVIKRVNNYLEQRVSKKYPDNTLSNNTGITTLVAVRQFANDFCNIPSATMEFCETRFGGKFGGSIDITNHLTHMVNYIGEAVKENIPYKKKISNINNGYHSINSMQFHSVNEDINAACDSSSLYAWYDAFLDRTDITVSKGTLCNSTVNSKSINYYKFTPSNPKTKMLIYAGAYDSYSFKSVFVLQNIIKYIYNSNDYIANIIKNTYEFTIIPIVNIDGFDTGLDSYDKNSGKLPTRSTVTTINGINDYNDYTNKTLNETNGIVNLVENNNYDAVLKISKRSNFAEFRKSQNCDLFYKLFNNCIYVKDNFATNTSTKKILELTGTVGRSEEKDYFASKNIDFVDFNFGTSPIDLGNPVCDVNKIEMKYWVEIIINSLLNCNTTDNSQVKITLVSE